MPASSNYTIREPLWLALMVVIGMLIGTKLRPDTESSLFVHSVTDETASKIGRVEEVIRFVDAKYVEDLDENELIENAVSSIFSELDPHSSYIPPDQLLDVEEDMSGLYEGIGVLTIFRNDTLYIQQVLEESPAKKAGIQVGDRILAIGKSKMSGTGKEYNELRPALQFSPSETKDVLLSRQGSNQKVSITSENIRVSAVESAYMITEKTVFIKLKRFSENVYKEFVQSLEALVEDPSQEVDLILDLRDNPGGYLPETIKILNQIFKDKEKVLVYTVDRAGKKTEYKTNGKRFYNIDKVAILINENSASASEIIAAAIQDWDRGIVLGQQSFGKGLVQEQYRLKNGGAIRLTVSRYHTPSGRMIQKPYDYDFATSDADSSSFYTLELKRKVKGSGGIHPDMAISDSTEKETETCSLAKQDAGFFFAREIYSSLNDEEFLQSYEDYLVNEYEIDPSYLCKDGLMTVFEKLRLEKDSGTSTMLEKMNETDPVIQAAIRQLSKPNYFSF